MSDQYIRKPVFRIIATANANPSPEPLFTGDKSMLVPYDFELTAELTLKQAKPYPLTMLAITRKVHVY